jgi:hypothetical protein
MADDRIPAEFLGMARQLRRDVQVADAIFNVAVPKITDALRDRLRVRRPTSKSMSQMARDVVTSWHATIPSRFRLEFDSAASARSVEVVEARVGGSRWSTYGLFEDERGISVNIVVLRTVARDVSVVIHPVANVSLHALARRFQRGENSSVEAVLRDLGALAEPPAGSVDAVATSDGVWLGEITDANDTGQPGRTVRLRSVRSFVGGESLEVGRYAHVHRLLA